MCVPIWKRDPRTRILVAIATVSLITGISLPHFFPVSGWLDQDRLDGLRGLLFGLSIGLNAFALRSGARCAPVAQTSAKKTGL